MTALRDVFASKADVSLESGDHLSQAEFHRRYSARPDIKKAELVEGVVYVGSPVYRPHAQPHALATTWLTVYASTIPGLLVLDNITAVLAADNEVQPDVCLLRTPVSVAGGRLQEDDYIVGPPDLVIEIAASSASYDLHSKKRAYQRAGVPEYIVWRVLDGVIDWFYLDQGTYVLRQADGAGVIESVNFPGLRLPVTAMLTNDATAVIAAVTRP